MKLAKLKKTLAVLLSAAMVFSAVPVTAMADVVESEAIEVSGAEEIVETEEAATEEVDAEIEESDESQDVEVSGVEEETEAVEELDAVEDNDAVEEDVVGDEEDVVGASDVLEGEVTADFAFTGETLPAAIQCSTAVAMAGAYKLDGEVVEVNTGSAFVVANEGKLSPNGDNAQFNQNTYIYLPVPDIKSNKVMLTVVGYPGAQYNEGIRVGGTTDDCAIDGDTKTAEVEAKTLKDWGVETELVSTTDVKYVLIYSAKNNTYIKSAKVEYEAGKNIMSGEVAADFAFTGETLPAAIQGSTAVAMAGSYKLNDEAVAVNPGNAFVVANEGKLSPNGDNAQFNQNTYIYLPVPDIKSNKVMLTVVGYPGAQYNEGIRVGGTTDDCAIDGDTKTAEVEAKTLKDWGVETELVSTTDVKYVLIYSAKNNTYIKSAHIEYEAGEDVMEGDVTADYAFTGETLPAAIQGSTTVAMAGTYKLNGEDVEVKVGNAFVVANEGKLSPNGDNAQFNQNTYIYLPVPDISKKAILTVVGYPGAQYNEGIRVGGTTDDCAIDGDTKTAEVEAKTLKDWGVETELVSTTDVKYVLIYSAKNNTYIKSAHIEYTAGGSEKKNYFGDAYIAKTFDSAPVVNREKPEEGGKVLKAHIFDAETNEEIDAVASFDEKMYMGNSASAGGVGENNVKDNLIWVDGNTLVITPHTDKNGYSLLKGGTDYYVTLDEGLVTVDGADAAITTAADWPFSTTIFEPQENVINVGPKADFETLSGAFNYLRKKAATGDWRINVAKGVYHERPFYFGNANITIKGEEGADFGEDVHFTWKNVDDWTSGGARGRCTFLVQGAGDMNLMGISMENSFDRTTDYDDGSTQAETLCFDSSGKLFVYDCGFDSHQDTLYIGRVGNRSWFYKSYIAGDVDFLWGYPGVCLFEECTLRCYADTAKTTPLAHLIASRTDVKAEANLGANKGFVIMNSTIQLDKGVTVTYARNSGADSNAAIFNNEFTGEGTLNPALYGSAPGYEVRDINDDLVVGYMDGDNTYNGTKVDTKDRLEHCDALTPRMQNREYSGRYVILNRGYDFATEKFVTAKKIWDATALAQSCGIDVTADDSANQIFVEPVGYKNVIGGTTKQYDAYDITGAKITDDVTWSVTEVDADDESATGNTPDVVDATIDATGLLTTKELTRSKVTVTATYKGKSDDGLCAVIPRYVPADTVQLSLISGAVDLYGTKTIGGVLSCSTNAKDDVTITKTKWTTSDNSIALFYDESTKKFVDTVTTKTCSVMLYGAGSGTTTITATTEDGGSDTFELTVYDDQTVWLPFVAGVLVNTDVQNGKWGTYNGMFIDAVTYHGVGNTAKVGMKDSSPTRMQTRNVILSFPAPEDVTVKVTLDAQDKPYDFVTADTVGTRVYQGLDTINNANISWDAETRTYTIEHKAADAVAIPRDADKFIRTAEGTEEKPSNQAAQGPDAGISDEELAKTQYLQLAYGGKDVYVLKYVFTKPGHQDIEDVADTSVKMNVDHIDINRQTVQLEVGKSEKVTATAVYPDGDKTDEVEWTSADESIATVAADGTITGVAAGETTVTASKDGKTATVEVTVKEPGRAIITDKAAWITDDIYAEKIAADKMSTKPVDTEDGFITFYPSIYNDSGKAKSRVDADTTPAEFEGGDTYTRNMNLQAGAMDTDTVTGAYFEFATAGKAKVTTYWRTAGSAENNRYLCLYKVVDDELVLVEEEEEEFEIDETAGKKVAKAIVSNFTINEAGLYRLGAKVGAKVYAFKVVVGGSDEPEPGPGPEPEPTPDEPGTVSGDTVDKTGDPVLSEKTVAEVSANYADMAAASAKGAADRTVVVKGVVSDNGVLIQNYKKGKVKSITISTNSVSDCRVTVNAKVKVFLPAGFGGVGAISNMTGVGKTKPLKVNKKGAVSLKAFKGVSKYDVTFTGASGKITITVVNLAFDKALKKLQVSANAVLTVRPTLQAGKMNDIKAGAGFLNGVWMVDKTIISKPGQTVSGKNGAKVTLNANGTVTVTNVANKNVKLTYMLNGKKYVTALKVQKKASGSEGAYKTAGLLK